MPPPNHLIVDTSTRRLPLSLHIKKKKEPTEADVGQKPHPDKLSRTCRYEAMFRVRSVSAEIHQKSHVRVGPPGKQLRLLLGFWAELRTFKASTLDPPHLHNNPSPPTLKTRTRFDRQHRSWMRRAVREERLLGDAVKKKKDFVHEVTTLNASALKV